MSDFSPAVPPAFPDEAPPRLLLLHDPPDTKPAPVSGPLLEPIAARLARLGARVQSLFDPETAAVLLRNAAERFDALIVAFAPGGAFGVLRQLPRSEETLVPVLIGSEDPTGPEVASLLDAGLATDCLPYSGSDALLRARLIACSSRVRLREREGYYRALMTRERNRADALLNAVIPIGAALTAEKDLGRLLERILVEAQKFCNCDGGSLYLHTDHDLRFAIVRNETLGIAMGGTSGREMTFPPVPLRDHETGTPNSRHIVAHAALTGTSVNIDDAYGPHAFDFSGTRAFDARTGYRSTSLLTVPLLNSVGKVIGVLQLINAMDWQTKEIVPFDANMQQIIEALGRLAAVALEGYLREQRLTEQLDQLRIEIDQAKKAKHVAEITETDYFRQLRDRSKHLRERHRGE